MAEILDQLGFPQFERFDACDVLIMAAAVADYAPAEPQPHKLKKSDDDLTLRLVRTRSFTPFVVYRVIVGVDEVITMIDVPREMDLLDAMSRHRVQVVERIEMRYFERGLADTRASVTEEMEREYRELAETLREIIYPEAVLTWDSSKPDGMPRKLLDSARLNALGWRPRTPLREGLAADGITVHALTTGFADYLIAGLRRSLLRPRTGRASGRRRVFVGEARLIDSEGELAASGTGTFMRSHIPLSGLPGYVAA